MKSDSNSIGQNPLKRKTPISYYGGKQSMLKNILPLIPKHIHYVEPFFGGGAVFWAKEPSSIEIINDYNDNVVNFYRVMKMRFEELQKIVQSTPFSREIYKNALLIYNTPQAFDPLKSY
jgi:DNA adenine methylase